MIYVSWAWGSERLSNLPEVTQLGNSRTRFWTMLSPQSWDSCQCSMLPLDSPCNCPWPFTHSCLLDGNYLCLKWPPNLWSFPYIRVRIRVRVSDFCKKPHLPKCHLPKVHSCIWFLFATTGFPDSSVGKESSCNAEDPSSIPESGRSPGEGIGYPLWYSGTSLVVQLIKNPPAMWETWVWSLGWEDPLKKGKGTHSSILAWRIPWTV